MNRTQAFRRLARPYAMALRLHENGRDDEIPSRLGIEPEAVGPLLRVAEAKLTRLLEQGEGTRSPRTPAVERGASE